jgi:hypothetical protein
LEAIYNHLDLVLVVVLDPSSFSLLQLREQLWLQQVQLSYPQGIC